MWWLQPNCESGDPSIRPPHTCILSCSLQPSLGKRHPPFRLPQEHRLFERLQELVTKGELSKRPLDRTGPFACSE